VQGQILSSLQSTVTTLQGKVATLFSAVQSQIDAAFQAQTQAMIDQLGTKFMQNGLKTPGEAQLAAMQAQDALQSQLDSIQQAKDQLSQDQGGSLTGVVYDAATGITKNIYNAAAAKQIAADQKNLDAANRQYDEYMLGIKADRRTPRCRHRLRHATEGVAGQPHGCRDRAQSANLRPVRRLPERGRLDAGT